MDNKRLLLQLEQTRREINREIINPEIKTLSTKDLKPILTMVARARAAYVQELFTLANATGKLSAPADVQKLKQLREIFDELVHAANALETMISRGYLDVEGRLGPD
jgi:hypothetical protein